MGCELHGIHSAARLREMPSWLRLEMPMPVDDKRFVDDVEGTCWRVTPARHGFDVLRELAAHFGKHRLDPRNLGLPISQAVSNRLRRRLGHEYKVENAAWWAERLEDLDRLDLDTFAAKHGVIEGTVSVMRLRLCGKRPKRTRTRLSAQDRPSSSPIDPPGKWPSFWVN